jgi:hypothetical protein
MGEWTRVFSGVAHPARLRCCVDGFRAPAGRARVGEWRLSQGAPPLKFDQRPPGLPGPR